MQITISKEAHDRLAEYKLPGESWTDCILRKFEKRCTPRDEVEAARAEPATEWKEARKKLGL